MHPILFQIVIPAGWGKPAAVLAVLLVVAFRAISGWRGAKREGDKVGVGRLVREDVGTTGVLGAALAALWKLGYLEGEIRLPLHSYGLLIASAFLVGIWLAQREARRRGQDPERLADLSFWILVAALVGSRVFFVLVNYDDYFGSRAVVSTAVGRIPRLLAFWEGGLVFYGGFIGAALTAWWYMRRAKMPFLAHADTLIPSVAFGHFLGRLGCFFAGCCWGGVAGGHLPWAVAFPPDSLAFQTFASRADPTTFLAADRHATLPLHPVQLYESFGELGLFLLLVLVVRPRKAFHGQVLATWLLSYAVLRTVVEFFRADVERGVVRGFGVGQWTSLAIFVAGAAIWAKARAGATAARAAAA